MVDGDAGKAKLSEDDALALRQAMGVAEREVRQEDGSRDAFERNFQAMDRDSDRRISRDEFVDAKQWALA